MTCLSTNELVGFLAGQLSPAALEEVDRHLDGCTACRILVAELVRAEEPQEPTGEGEMALATTAPLGIRPLAARAPEAPPPDPGTQEPSLGLDAQRVAQEIPGRYQVREELRRGGQARILRVFDTLMGREVALKELLRLDSAEAIRPTEDAAARARRFLREARITASLSHPTIVQVLEVGQRLDGALYYTMPLVHGRTLEEEIRRRPDLEARLSLLVHFEALCQGVAYAHEQGVIHRDIKPQNVMVGSFGETVLLDWGLAKRLPRAEEPLARRHEEPEALTAAGMTLGTPAYMSPEQAAGQLACVDERSDVWGLGAVLYHLLTGIVPFHGATAAQLVERVLTATYEPVLSQCPRTPPALAALAERALRRERDRRPASVTALLGELETHLHPLPLSRRDDGPPTPSAPPTAMRRQASRERFAWLAAGAVALVGLGVIGLQARRHDAAQGSRGRLLQEARASRHALGARSAQARALGRELAAAQLAWARRALRDRNPRLARLHAAAALLALESPHRGAQSGASRTASQAPDGLREAALRCYVEATELLRASHPLRQEAFQSLAALRHADPRRLLLEAEAEAGLSLTAQMARLRAPERP